MNRSSQLRAARLAGGVLLLAAVVPGFAAGAALAADAPAGTTEVVTSADTSYADEVAIGTAVKIAAPGVAEEDAAQAKTVVKAAPTTSASPASAEPTSEATPSDAEVIETESRQAASEDPTEVAVLGTKIGSGELADTGPSQVMTQALVALALIAGGLALRTGPALVTAANRRRH